MINADLTGRSPLVPGHEIVGRIAAVGEGVAGWKVGDRVGAGWHGGHDGEMPPDLIMSHVPYELTWDIGRHL